MPRARVALLVPVLFAAALAAQTPAPSHPDPGIPRNLKTYFVGLLVRGVNYAQPRTPEERDQQLRRHRAYIRSQIETGNYLIAGPFLDDGPVRGIVVIQAASAEAAKRIADADPLVQSGWLAAEIHPAMLPDLAPLRVDYPKEEVSH